MTQVKRSRVLENIGFGMALIVGTVYALSETITHVGFSIGTGNNDKFPWGVLIMVVTFSLPKILGRATAGRIWSGIAGKLPGGNAGKIEEEEEEGNG